MQKGRVKRITKKENNKKEKQIRREKMKSRTCNTDKKEQKNKKVNKKWKRSK